MKRVLIGLLIVGVLLVAGVAVFLATFNVDRYRPLVETKLEEALDKPVDIERLSLGLTGGIAVEVKGLTIREADRPEAPVIVRIDTAAAVLQLMPLLRRQVRISSVVLKRPQVHLSRDAQGRINLMGAAIVGSPAAAPAGTSAAGAPVDLNIARLSIDDGIVRWTDAMAQPPMDVQLDQLRVDVTDISLDAPMQVNAQAAAFATRPNVKLSARVRLPSGGAPGSAESVDVSVNLDAIELPRLAKALPAVQQSGLREFGGELTAAVDRVEFTPQAAANLKAKVWLARGRVILAQLGSPVQAITVQAVAQPGRVDISKGSAQLAGGTVALTGRVEGLPDLPRSTVDLNVERVDLGALTRPPAPGQPSVQGTLTLAAQATAQGLAWPQLSRTLNGQSRVMLLDGVVKNLNIVRLVFEKLSVIPGLVPTLQARLPASYSEKLSANDTTLQPIDMPITVANGTAILNQFTIKTDTAEIQGSGQVTLSDMMASIQSTLFIDPDLSAAIIRSLEELRNLTDAQGRLAIPVAVQGKIPEGIRPNLQYIAQRLVMEKAGSVINELIQRAIEKNAPEPSAPAGSTPSGSTPPSATPLTAPPPLPPGSPQPAPSGRPAPSSPWGSLLEGVLNQALGPDSSQQSAQEPQPSSPTTQ